jgi:Holliday junction DNA helicase RuvA
MIARLIGKVIEKEERSIVLNVNGVGYRVAILPSLRQKARDGMELSLQIYHHISSETQTLFGFEGVSDLECFKLLLTVPSVGPRTAMSILEAAAPRVLAQAVAEGDVVLLTKVSGVGRKTAERILIELKGKIETGAVSGVVGGVQQEAVEALTSLGFTALQAREAVANLPKNIKTVEDAVRHILQRQKA